MSKKLEEKLDLMTSNEKELWALRHTAEHVLHTALQNLYPKLKKAMGPATKEGFYNDFDLDEKISEEDFPKIEKEMQRLIDTDFPMIQEYISVKEAKKIFKNNPYKIEWIEDIEKRGEKISTFRMGSEEVDLCSGPHAASTGKVKAFKLLSVAGAYWHGDEKNKMLTRIYGTCFPSKEELDNYLNQIEEAKKRDHRKIGKELDLFSFSDLVGGGLPLYSPKGALLRALINQHVENVQAKQGYMQVWTPQIAKAELFKTSGHYDKYKVDMFKVISNYSEEEFYLKPMNCPQHTQIYAAKPRSYKDLPLRYTDFAMLYRDEKPGELSGLARVRSFSQDDCHVFCMESQVDEEADRALTMTKEIMKVYGFKYRYRLSTRDSKHPEKYLGDPETWDKVEKWAVEIMERNKIEYYDGPGEAAFYAPKMDLMATDSLGREWQLSTLQIDFFLPERFKLTYIDIDSKEKRPVMLHRAILGSTERFLMILIEHFAGNFPTWLSPVQVQILPISEKVNSYSQKVFEKLIKEDIRVELNKDGEPLGAKIRKAQMEKVPYMVIIGEKEEKDNKISVRSRSGKNLGVMDLDKFIKDLGQEINEKKIN
jgi:threonyl-tRNA synthetase